MLGKYIPTPKMSSCVIVFGLLGKYAQPTVTTTPPRYLLQILDNLLSKLGSGQGAANIRGFMTF